MVDKTFDLSALKRRTYELAFTGIVNIYFGTIDAVRYVSELKLRLQARRKR